MSTWLSLRAPTHAPPPLQAGWTALHYAAMSGHSATVEVLLKAGADVEACDKVVGVGREGGWGAGCGGCLLALGACMHAF